MSTGTISTEESLKNLCKEIQAYKENIVLLFAFNGTGKTRLSVEYKNSSKKEDGQHTGVYYNSYSEDLFQWYEDSENPDNGIVLNVLYSSLNQYHSMIDENVIKEKLEIYKPKFDFEFSLYMDDPSKGIEFVRFFPIDDYDTSIKVSRGEEQLFIWCFFLALFDVQGWQDKKEKAYLFIDDPVSSLDENNIFVTVTTLLELIEKHYDKNKIIITTHHAVFYSLLSNWLTKGEKADKFKKHSIQRIIKSTNDGLKIVTFKKDVFIYHLELMQTIAQAIEDDELYNYHFAILRQVIENISSFLGSGQVSYVLEQVGLSDKDRIMQMVNALSHEKIFRLQPSPMSPDSKRMFIEIFNAIMTKYNFIVHVEEKK